MEYIVSQIVSKREISAADLQTDVSQEDLI